ncbi:MAG: AAA family ATPase [Candidatus Pacearchaeota archaeon]
MSNYNKSKIPTPEVVNSPSPVIILEPTLEHEIYISDALQKKLDEILTEIKNKSSLGYLAGTGAILTGFQGTGKTVLVKKIAKDLKAKIIVIDKEMRAEQMKQSFDYARNLAKEGENVIIFIDEIDAFGQKEYARFGTGLSKITALMTELDGINSFNPKGIYYVFAATNYLENVDDRLLRPGRLEEIIDVPLPDIKARKEIIKIHQENKANNPHKYKIPDDVVDYLAKKTNGYTPADLRSLVKHCCIEAEKRKDKKVSIEDAEKTLNEFTTSVKRGLDYFTEPRVTLDAVIGREIYKEFLIEILKKEEAKCLLYGPMGVGKTLMPEALAGSLDYNHIYARGSELQEGIVGEGTKKLKKLFQRAQMAAPCIVLLDEIKGIVTERNTFSHKDDETAFLNSLLSRPLPGVYLFVTTNNPLEINETTLSRFEYKVFFELPNEEERKIYFEKILDGFDGYSDVLAKKTEGYSFRDLERITKALNRIEKKLQGNNYDREQVLDYIISKYVPENKNSEINWKAVRNLIGDSIEVEKFVYSIIKNVHVKK